MRLLRSRRRAPEGGAGSLLPFDDGSWSLPHPLAVLNVAGAGDRHTLLGYAENISRHGMMIGTVWPKEVDRELEIEFALPEPVDLVVRCICRVAWARPHSIDPNRPGMGLEFIELPESVADRIESLRETRQMPESAACRTWSEFDQAWIPWARQAPR